MKTHERLAGVEPAKGGSDRGFGVVFAVPRPHGGRRTRPLIASRCFDTAWRFPGTDLDCLAIGNCFLRKAAQDRSRERVDSFEPN